MIKEAIEKVTKRIDLSEEEMRQVFGEIMSGKAVTEDMVAFLTALKAKGETIEEISGAARVMREKAVRINAGGGVVLDTCGTGGSGINTFNISTTAAFVVAGCGVKVAKHGNRSASSHCGSADVLEAFGVKIDMRPEAAAKCIKEISIGFLFAPSFHLAMKYASPARKAVEGRTIFNILGPLSNPASATHQLMGVCDARLTEVMANVLKNLGTKRALVVCGEDSLDEITITGATRITELQHNNIKTYNVSPEDFGVKKAGLEDIKGSGAKENAGILLSILKGDQGPRRDVVVMNASAALVCAGKAADFKMGAKIAAESIDSGHALGKLFKLIECTNQ